MPKQRVKVVPRDADYTTSYVLNSGVTEPNLTKFLQDVLKWLLITLLKSKLRSSNPFGNANVRNENRRQIAAKIVRFNSVNFKIIRRKFTKFGHDVAWLLPLNLLQSANPLSNTEAKSKGRSLQCLPPSSKFNWLP